MMVPEMRERQEVFQCASIVNIPARQASPGCIPWALRREKPTVIERLAQLYLGP